MTHAEANDKSLLLVKDYKSASDTLCRVYRNRCTGSFVLEITDSVSVSEVIIRPDLFKMLGLLLINETLKDN